MTNVFVVGDSADSGIENLIKTQLSSSYQITYIKDKSVLRIGSGYEILVIDCEDINLPELSEYIVLMKCEGVVPSHGFSANLSGKSVIIANSENTAQLETLKAIGQTVISCGRGKRDTLSYTSLTTDGIVISLNREITAFSGKKVQPLEIPVKFTPGTENIYDFIAFTALRLVLDDFNSEIGFLY